MVPADAAVITNETILFTDQEFVPCANGGAGEFVDFSGQLHFVFAATMNGKNLIVHDTVNPLDVVGIGESTGDTYHFVSSITNTGKTSMQNGQATITIVNPLRVIGSGAGAVNFVVVFNQRVTFNANGTMTSLIFRVTTECK